MRRVLLPLLLTAALAGGLAMACHRGSGTGETWPNAPIVLISIDTLRSDHLPAYGYQGVATPAIDALRKDAILFEKAYSHYPLTLPSHTSMLSGLLPTHTGVRDNSGYTFDAAHHPYLPQILKKAGYDAGAAVSAFILRHGTGLASGFDLYDDDISAGAGTDADTAQRAGDVTAGKALEWIKGRGGKPFFFFLHLYEPHSPYEPPEPFASRYRNLPY